MTARHGTRVVLVGGSTETAAIDGISAAGADPDAMVHTPSADAEILAYGRPVRSPVVPVSPTGCPTPAVVTRAVRERLGFDVLALDAGMARTTAAPTVTVGDEPGADIREARPVLDAEATFTTARELGRSLPDEELVVGETIPGGTTTALAILTALGERRTVSSSLPSNPLDLKREVVATALEASDLESGSGVGAPIETVARVGDPVLATVAGLVVGTVERGADVTLAGGTQMAATAALVRHAGFDAPLELATTPFVASDETAAIHDHTTTLNLDLTVTDPGFESSDHPAMAAYVAGKAKEGVGMGGALALADRAGLSMADVRESVLTVYDRLDVGGTGQ